MLEQETPTLTHDELMRIAACLDVMAEQMSDKEQFNKLCNKAMMILRAHKEPNSTASNLF